MLDFSQHFHCLITEPNLESLVLSIVGFLENGLAKFYIY